jgi:hypothetical protein
LGVPRKKEKANQEVWLNLFPVKEAEDFINKMEYLYATGMWDASDKKEYSILPSQPWSCSRDFVQCCKRFQPTKPVFVPHLR